MLSKSQRDELRQSIKYSMEVHGEYFELPIENSTLGELLDAADELDEIKRLPVVEHLRNTIQMQEAELRHLRERAENAESDRNAFRERFKEQSAMAERAEAALKAIRVDLDTHHRDPSYCDYAWLRTRIEGHVGYKRGAELSA